MEENSKKTLMTKAGLAKLEEELRVLKEDKRAEIAQKIKVAREQGDLSENAEYDAAKDEQRDLEARIEEIETLLRSVSVVSDKENDGKKVNVGCSVKVRNLDMKKDQNFEIVGSNEADSLTGKISNESPVGSALMGKEVGDTVIIETPAGQMRLKIKSITLTS